MLNYTVVQWLFFFYFYCFFGWVFESTYVSIRKRKIVNRGFMRGPFLPIYGSGAIMMLVVSMPFQDNVVMTYLAGCLGATVLEFVTGTVMEALFKVRYWDYSDQKFNFKGHICLSSSLAWGVLTIFMTGFLHKKVEALVFHIPETVMTGITVAVSLMVVVDFTLSFKAALELRDMLIGLEKAREEMERIRKRLDVLIAVTNDEIETRMQESSLRAEELVDHLEARFERVKEKMKLSPGNYLEEAREELIELRSRYLIEKEHRLQFKRLRDFYQRHLILGNPSMHSAKFNEALEELKKAVREYKDNRGKDDEKEGK